MGALVNAVRQALEEEIDALKTSMEVAAMNARLEEEKSISLYLVELPKQDIFIR